jgi:hypothetical protein
VAWAPARLAYLKEGLPNKDRCRSALFASAIELALLVSRPVAAGLMQIINPASSGGEGTAVLRVRAVFLRSEDRGQVAAGAGARVVRPEEGT